MAADSITQRFTRWRQSRPFVAGLLIALAGIVILTPAYLSFTVADIVIQISSLSGVSTLLIGVLLITVGLMTWFKHDVRIFTGVVAILLGIVALPASNFGGFILGTLLAIIGGAWSLSWSDVPKRKDTAAVAPAADTTEDDVDSVDEDTHSYGDLPASDPVEVPERPKTKSSPSTGTSSRTTATSVAIAFVIGLVVVTGSAGNHYATAQLPLPPAPQFPPLLPPGVLPPGGLIGPGTTGPDGEHHKAYFDTTTPEARPGERPPTEGNYLITSDKVTLVGNVKFSLVDITTQQGVVKQGIRIDSDKAILDNLAVTFPAGDGSSVQQMSSGPGVISTLTGHFHIIVAKTTMTPVIEGVPTIPITLDASWAPEELTRQLNGAVSMGMPDDITSHMTISNAVLDTYIVRSDTLELPAATIEKP